jgi:hypothetical protein
MDASASKLETWVMPRSAETASKSRPALEVDGAAVPVEIAREMKSSRPASIPQSDPASRSALSAG